MSLRAGLLGIAFALTVACTTPQGVTLIVLLDSSASFAAHRAEAIKLLSSVCQHLERGVDHVTVLRMSREVYSLFDGDPRSRELAKALEAYSQVTPDESGTAYGLGLQRGLEAASAAAQAGTLPAVWVLGDGADERVAGKGNIQWDKLGQDFKAFPADGRLAFVFVEPKWGDRFGQALGRQLGDRLKRMTPVEARGDGAAQALRQFIQR